MKIKDITRTSTFAWSSDVIPLLATGSVAGAVDLDFSASSSLEIFDVFVAGHEPIFSATLENKFHALAWLQPFGNYARGLLVGAFETGLVEFWDAEKLIKTRSLEGSSVFKSSKHTGAVKCLAFNPHQKHILVSGGQKGEILIWDASTFSEPYSPGRSMVPLDEITSVAWNNSKSHILASTSSSGYTSIWDLKAKKELLHMLYNGPLGKADFSQVAWHPHQSTTLVTASQSDTCPAIMKWDLRNNNEPGKVLMGHEKGVLSLDWCSRDDGLLLSSGKDNSMKLWNPMTGEKLGDFAPAANWTFLARFAPRAPDVIASASFDGKIVVQSLQDTSPPVTQNVKSADDNNFWENLSTNEHLQPLFVLKQAPQWLKRPCSASFGFGSKLVTVRTVNGKSSVSISNMVGGKTLIADKLTEALRNDDFSELIAEKIREHPTDVSDWQILDNLSKHGKDHFLKDILEGSKLDLDDKPAPSDIPDKTDNADEDDFFANLSNDVKKQSLASAEAFAPSGPFKILSDSDGEQDAVLARLILCNKISEAVDKCLEQGKLLEALVLSLDQDESVKSKVKARYFKETHYDVLSRLIYSASSRSVVDLVANADITNWKEIASSISAYCTDKTEFNAKIVELGDRILSANQSPADRRNALECYLAGEALDKVAALWLRELPSETLAGISTEDATPLDAKFATLSGFVEKLSAYRSLSKITSPLSGPAIEPTCNAIFEFATLASTSGNFELARAFLSILPENYDGLVAEKERINKATELPAQKVTQGRGRITSGVQNGRYGAKSPAKPFNPLANNATPAFNGGAPGAPYARPPPAAGMQQKYGSMPPATASSVQPPRTQANPYSRSSSFARPAAAAVAPPVNAYAPQPHENPVGVPPFGNAANPYTPVQPAYSTFSPPTSSLSGPNVKEETDGWNDLPDSFKAKSTARRSTPAAAAVVSPRAPAQPLASASSAPPIRKAQPQTAPSMGPPPPRASSRQPSQASSPRRTPATRQASMNHKYAPPPNAIQMPPQNGLSATGSKASTPLGPPKNPYAPPANANPPPPKVSAVQPPTQNFSTAVSLNTISQTPAQPPSNPYAPTPTGSAQPPSNPYAPPQKQASQPPQNPYAPSSGARGPNGQYSTPASARTSRKPSMGNVLGPPPSRPQAKTGSPSVGPPPTKAQAQAQAQPQSHAPPAPASASMVPAPQVMGSHAMTGNTTTAPPPHRNPSTAAAQAPNSNAPPPPPQAAPAVPPQSAPQTQSSAQPAQNGDVGRPSLADEEIRAIMNTFTNYKDKIKPAAPAKYEKHVIDMEKRLNILFNHLRKNDLLSPETVKNLKDVAASLESKQWTTASNINLGISQSHPNETGAWHVGVKRLITFAEAFDA